MSDPRRLWEQDGLGAPEREALRAARQLDPPASLREEAWKALAAALPPPAMDGATPEPPGSLGSGSGLPTRSAGSGFPLLKVVVMAAAVCTSAAGARWIASKGPQLQVAPKQGPGEIAPVVPQGGPTQGSAEIASVVLQGRPTQGSGEIASVLLQGRPKQGSGEIASPLPSAATFPAPRPGSAEAEHRSPPTRGTAQPLFARIATGTRPPQTAAHEPVGSPPAGASSSGSSSRVSDEQSREPSPPDPGLGDGREESRMVARAREALRAGNTAQAIALLDDVRARYPSGVLVQERELLWIESLVRSGQSVSAREHAQTFVRTWPESPYTARLREIVASQ